MVNTEQEYMSEPGCFSEVDSFKEGEQDNMRPGLSGNTTQQLDKDAILYESQVTIVRSELKDT